MNVLVRIICKLTGQAMPRCRRFVNAELFEVARELGAWGDAGLIPPRDVVERAKSVTRAIVREGLVSMEPL